MSKAQLRVALALSAAAALAFTSAAHALEQAAVFRSSTTVDGVKGNQGIRTNPATVAGVGFVHPVQIDTGSAGVDFVAIGTANGAGTHVPGRPNCADDYDPSWSIYVDGYTAGLYWCYDVAQDMYNAGANPTFQIYYDYCSGPFQQWVLTFAATRRACIGNAGSSGVSAAVGLETTGSSLIDRNIDVKYTNLMINPASTVNWWQFSADSGGADPNYSFQIVNATSANVYLAPLD